MTTFSGTFRAKAAFFAGCAAILSCFAAQAQKPEARIVTPIDNAARVTIPGTRPPFAQANDAGRMAGTTKFLNVTMTFGFSPAQQTALDTLIAAQQNPASAQYRQWLTPDQFAAQFGAADSDIAQVEAWLQAQGLSVDGVSRNRREISFSGSVAQIETAFGTEMHYYRLGGEQHFAPSTDVSVPAAFSGAIMSVSHLTDLKPKTHFKRNTSPATGRLTSGVTGSHFTTPGDVAVEYDINAAYNSGYTGAGQIIAIVGQSAVVNGDIANFQTAAGVPVRSPVEYLIPSTGSAYVSSGDEEESDLDLEYASAIARGATIYFYYTGNQSNTGGAFYALQQATQTAPPGQTKLATIISSSYGNCEVALGSAQYTTLNTYLAQAATQGQTVLSASGDAGSADCYGDYGSSSVTNAQVAGASVDFPASSQYVTGIGGTEFPSADVTSSSTTYWNASTGLDVVTSLIKHIPEQVWNDSSATSGLSAGGGGVSIYTAAPSWQKTTVPGLVANTFRQVPDVSLDASPNNAGYLICSSDYQATGITGSCSYGFRDYADNYFTVIGGTSVATPIFAGMVAIINQAKGLTIGAGNINPTLYSLASNSTTYASAFNDITSGNNECISGTGYAVAFNSNGTVSTYGPACSAAAAAGFAAGTGYDDASGLGSVDLNNLLTAWPGTNAVAPKFALSAPAASVGGSASGTVTVTVTPSGGYTGTVGFTVSTVPLISGSCYTVNNATVTGTTAVTATVTIYSAASLCPTGAYALLQTGAAQAMVTTPAAPARNQELPLGIAMAGLLAMGVMGRRSRKLRGVVMLAMLAAAGFGLSGCGGSGGSGTTLTSTTGTTTTGISGVAAAGTYTVTVTGADSSAGQQAQTTFSLTIL